MLKTSPREGLALALVLLLDVGAFVVDVFYFPEVILPGPPFFLSILIAAYFLSPRTTAGVAVFATALKLIADLLQGTPVWLLTLYFFALVLVGLAGTALARRIEREAALAGERERLLAEVQHRAADLDEANKELEAFSYSVSHDLRAPLRHIDGFSQILLEDYADKLDEQGKAYLQRLRGGSQKMGELIDAMLQLSRVTRAEMKSQPVNLSEIAESILADLRKAQPDRQVDVTVAPGVIVNGDTQMLRVVLENLLDNAWKFTSKRPVARIEFGATQQDGRRVHYVRDNGSGFDMAHANKLFCAFQRLHSDNEYPGTGIGLATVQRIVSRHGGRIWAEAEVDKGASFYFTLSAATPKAR